MSSPEPASGWRRFSGLSTNTEAESGPKRNQRRAPFSISRWLPEHRRQTHRKAVKVTPKDQIEILLVEDDSEDAELALHALTGEHVCNSIRVARDGEEALDILFRTGPHSNGPDWQPTLILLDLKLPKVGGMEV